jgi:hypothetical protein
MVGERTPNEAQRRRTAKHTNTGAPGPSLWVTTQAWGRCR